MEPIVLWQHKWGLTFHIPWYLFLGGLAGGTMFLGGVAQLLSKGRGRFEEFARAAVYVTVPAILLGGLSLTFHLGKPERGFAFPLFFTNYKSWMTIGGWVLGAFAPISIIAATAWYLDLSKTVKNSLAAIAVPLGILMSLYTGFLLSAAWVVPGNFWYVPLWDNRYLPLLFVLSGISTGVAATGLTALIAGRRSQPGAAGQAKSESAGLASAVDIGAIAVEAAWIFLFLTALAAGSLGQQMAYKLVTRGELAPWFWWGFIATGLAAPLLASLAQLLGKRMGSSKLNWVVGFKFVLVLVGGLMLRYVIVWGGDLKSPLTFTPSNWPVPGTAVSLFPTEPGG
jgi:formate-dependent nitrite reductase membrane component NrfD